MRLQGAGLDPHRAAGYLGGAKQQDRKESTTAKILRKCKKMAQLPALLRRRSFRAVGESCVINLIPDPKPDSSHPRALSRSRNWLLAVTGYPVKAPTTLGLVYCPSSGKVGSYV